MTKPINFYNEVYQEEEGYSLSILDTQILEKRRQEISGYIDGSGGMILEIGCGRGGMASFIPQNYVGLDISWEVLRKAKFMKATGSADTLPFKSNSFGFLFSFAVLEHLDYPGETLMEMCRVISPNGIIFLKPAWNCRSWKNKKLPKKPYSILSIREKIEKALIPVLDSLMIRGLVKIPKRILLDFIYALLNDPTVLRWKNLTPNYIYDQYWIEDADARISIDPHEVIWFYKSRGLTCISHPNFIRRIFARSEAVVFKAVTKNSIKI